MIPSLRQEFNSRFTERKYQRYLQRLNERFGMEISFRVCETPCFVPRAVQQECEQAAVELALQAHDPDYLARTDATLEPRYTVAGQPDRSMFIVVDFAMTYDETGAIRPKLIELQGFPSLMGFQLLMAEVTQEHFAISPELSPINGGLTRAEFVETLRRGIVDDADPENVVLLELDPWRQKTCPDFYAIRELLDIVVVDIRTVKKIGRKLHYERNGTLVPIDRIFNRAIVDELDRKQITIPFNWHDDLDVSWAGHPNWYFRISKFTLPFLDHPTVPPARFLNEVDVLPDNLNRYVLKPLYSFAGTGVVVGPTREDVENIPAELRSGFLLQERIEYADAIATPEGGTKPEIRYMLMWLPDEECPRPVMGLVRMGRGRMMGVDHNRDLRWIGASCNFFET